jgi:hypothetical protein
MDVLAGRARFLKPSESVPAAALERVLAVTRQEHARLAHHVFLIW